MASGAPGETDLQVMLASLDVERRAGVFTFVAVEAHQLGDELLAEAHGVVKEGATTTLVLPVEVARRVGLATIVEMAWLSLTVESSLEAVGLTAAFSKTLGDAGISCNVLAGYHRDHLLVPVERADDAIAALRNSSKGDL
jgi:hypothetical protein